MFKSYGSGYEIKLAKTVKDARVEMSSYVDWETSVSSPLAYSGRFAMRGST
jgi:hypothetical protein